MKRLQSLVAAIVVAMALAILFACSEPAPAPTVQAIAVEPATATAVPPTNTPLPPTDTPTLTNTPTNTPTDTATATATATATHTATPTNTATPTPTLTHTPTSTWTPTPTNTPTNTRTPTPTRKPATATPVPLTLQTALSRTANHSLRFEMSERFSDPYQEIEMLNARGEMTGQAAHMYVGGKYIEVLTGQGELEMILTPDKDYLHGPVPALKANEAKWYVAPASKRGATGAPSVDVDQLLAPDVTRYEKVGSETVDGLACETYSIDKEAARRALAASGAMTRDELDNMVNIEQTYWWCADGFVHRARVRVDMKYPPDPSTTMIVWIDSHYFDFDKPIQVTVPAEVAPVEDKSVKRA